MARPMSGRSRVAVLSSWLTIVSVACSRPAVTTAPSPLDALPPPSAVQVVALTVRVQTRTTELPIPGALVRHDGNRYYADESGQAIISVTPGRETTIEVSASGFEPMSASAVLANDERWTFYLAPEANPER